MKPKFHQSEIEIIFNLLGFFNFNVFSLFRNNKNTPILITIKIFNLRAGQYLSDQGLILYDFVLLLLRGIF